MKDPIKERMDFARIRILPGMAALLLREFGGKNEPDVLADDMCTGTIRKKYGADSILTEERSKVDANITGTNGYGWVIDPLDGTANYMQQDALFTISIALNRQGQLAGGLVYHLLSHTLYRAQKGKGAYMNGQRISVSDVHRLEDARISLVLDNCYTKHGLGGLQKHLEERITNPQKGGCTSLELCQVASGSLDGFVKPTDNPWGVSAGLLMVQEAGGLVSLYQPDKTRNVHVYVASNPHIHGSLCKAVETYFKK